MRTATGDERDIELVATDLRHDPAVTGVVLNCRDVTERNELERQLHHAQKLDAVGHLAGGLAHDFNNVLAAIRGYSELLREDLPADAPAAADLRHIEQAVDRAAAVTRKLLAFSRKQTIQPVVVDLNAILADLEPLLRQLVTDRIEVRTDFDPALWPLKADAGQLEQVIINLATNARDAMPAGGVLQFATANRTLAKPSSDTGSLTPGDYVALVVADQGIGMPPAIRARIFEPFFSTKARDRGLGLGLAMVHGIVTHAGGHIIVESVEGSGTTFTLLLPRTSDTLRAATTGIPAPSPQVTGRPILLVDDELGVRTVTRRMLERGGYRVTEASDGLAALDRIVADPDAIDLLVTDMVMPGLDGHGLVARVRALRPNLPIVCITGYAGDARGVSDLAPHVSAIITKPFAAATLLRAVAAALRVS
jgi:signal transduction histidine kinase/CheY-like chemotaxis protein